MIDKKELRIIKKSGLFDQAYYLKIYEDVCKSDIDPIMHYIKHGWKEGRNPSEQFDTNFYLETYPDVRNAGLNPLVHFIRYGSKEGRKTHDENPIIVENTISRINKLCKHIMQNPSLVKKFVFTVKHQGLKQAIQKTQGTIHRVKIEQEYGIKYKYIELILTNEINKEISSLVKRPLISIIMSVYNIEPKWLDLAIKSIEAQWYENWELCIVDDKSTNQKTIEYLQNIKHSKIKISFLEKSLNVSGACNEALAIANGEYIALMDNVDEITPDALYEVLKAINITGAEFIYSDEDMIEMNGDFSDPHFKPSFAPDTFLSQNYIGHLGVIKKELIDRVDGFTLGLEGAQNYDLYLKVFEYTNKVHHIQKVLYHRRKIPGSTAAEFSDKSYAQDAGVKALQNAISRRNMDAKVENGKCPGTYKVSYETLSQPLVSIIIPFKDKPELMKMCIGSILEKSTYQNFEIIGISNNSEEKETYDEMKRFEKLDIRIKFYEYNVPFNYSQINNHAVNSFSKGEYVVLLNNDIEIITPSWIEALLEQSQRPEIGAVGAKLYFPDGSIQHAGVVLGKGQWHGLGYGVAGHAYSFFNEKEHYDSMHMLNCICNYHAVTAACMMIKKTIFEHVDGFNEVDLSVAFNDVDLCLRIEDLGYRNVYTPYAQLYHHESISRGSDAINDEKQKRYTAEVNYMFEHYLDKILDDKHYNKNLSLTSDSYYKLNG